MKKTKTDLIVFLLLAAFLRLAGIGFADYWYDEGFSVIVARLPLARLIQATAGDVHPPLYYLMLWPIQQITDAAWATRLPSALLSLLAIYLTWRIMDQLRLTDNVQLVVIVWLVFSPIQLHYAQEARMYALLQAEVLACVYLILANRRWWFVVVATAMMYTHNYAVFYLPVFWLLDILLEYDFCRLCCCPPPHKYPKYLIGDSVLFMIPVLAWLPWFAVLLRQMSTVSAGYWIQPVTAGRVIKILYQMFFAWAMPSEFRGLAVVLVGGLLAYTAWRVYTDRPSHWQALTLLAFGPLALASIASILWRPLLLFRGLIGSAIFLVVLVVQALDRLRPWRALYAYAMIGVMVLAGAWGYYAHGADNKGNTSDWVGMITEDWQAGDVIWSLNDNGLVAARTYAADYPTYLVPSCGEEALGALSPSTRAALGVEARDRDALGANRIWYISTVSPVSSACEVATANRIIEDAELVESLADTEYHAAGVYLVQGNQ